MSALLHRLFKRTPEKYPKNLEARFSRILNKIVDLWGTDEFDAYLSDLMIDTKGDRQGFPPEIVSELFVLSIAHDEYLISLKENATDPWANEHARAELEDQNIEYSPRGFFAAIDAGNEAAVKIFIEAGVNLEEKNSSGWTPLMVSSFMGGEKSAELLINAGANVNAKDGRGYGPLHWAAYKGFLKICELLIAKGAFTNVRSDKGITPLLQAAACGHVGIVELLIANKAMPNDADSEGWTPLHKATANNHLNVVLALMEHDADPKLKHNSGLTPLDIAKQKGYKNVAMALTRTSSIF